MKRLVIIVTVLFALVTLINAYNLGDESDDQSVQIGWQHS